MPLRSLSLAALLALTTSLTANAASLGPRPAYLIDQMANSPLKEKLLACAKEFEAGKPIKPTLFSISHRGAPLQFPEHSKQGYQAGARMGAGILECDVTFTKDKELVCRHSQKDLATSTNILATDLARKCTTPFIGADKAGGKASVECRTSDLTLTEFQSLSAKMDGGNKNANTAADYMKGNPDWRTNLYTSGSGTLMTHKESIALFKSLGVKFTPELKAMGVNYLAPPLWMLVTLENNKIIPSAYAVEAKKAGLKLITWTLERSGPLTKGGGWYYQSIKPITNHDGITYELLHVLAQDVGMVGVFSDWPATTSFYANCFGLK